MSNRTDILYSIIFKSIKIILTQHFIYALQIESKTTDTELALINSLQNTFNKLTRLGC